MTRRELKLQTFAGFTKELACLSTCKRRQVGCLIAPLDFTQVLSIGYNGVPRGRPNDSCLDISGGCGCIHAESNAVAKLTSSTPALMVVTLSPCALCAGLILNVGTIKEFYYLEAWRDHKPLEMLAEGGIHVQQLYM